MTIKIIEESIAKLPKHGQISIAFWVESRLRIDVLNCGLQGLQLVEEKVQAPYIKDYDGIKGEGPERWLRRWDTSNWGLLAAFDGSVRVGGAVLAWQTPGLNMLEGRDDLTVLWDLRIGPDYRRQGVGSNLFARVVAWARERNCHHLKIETQNINVPACRFYARQGCELGAIHRWAYPDLPDEVRLLWYLEL